MEPNPNAKLHYKPANSPSLHPKPQLLKHNTPCTTSTIAGDDNELSIFDAERYFSETADSIKETMKLDVAARPKISSVSSEASWNSDSVLLPHQPSSHAGGFPSKKPRKSLTALLRRLFGRNCPCSGKKSVNVEEKLSDTKTPIQSNSVINNNNKTFSATATSKLSSNTMLDNGLSSIPERSTEMKFDKEITTVTITAGKWANDQSFFKSFNKPELGTGYLFKNSGRFTFPASQPQFSKNEEPSQDSLEVFRPTEVVKKPPEVQRRASVMPFGGESYNKSFSYVASPKTRPDDDAASDASSDLFEIESFSTSQATSHRRDSLDVAGIGRVGRNVELAPSECCPPSEVSVEWNVNTAEGFDRSSTVNVSSVGSDFEEVHLAKAETGRTKAMIVGDCRQKGNGVLSLSLRKSDKCWIGSDPVQ